MNKNYCIKQLTTPVPNQPIIEALIPQRPRLILDLLLFAILLVS